MSQFMSNKYLRYTRWSGAPIERDLPCSNCGYNLRGLNFGGVCPECGTPIDSPQNDWDDEPRHYADETHWLFGAMTRFGLNRDVLHTGAQHDRQRWRIGLALAAGVLFIVLLARLAVFLGLVFFSTSTPIAHYIGLGCVLTSIWIIATFMLTPPRIDGGSRNWRLVRYAVRLSSFGFVVGFPAMMARVLFLPGTQSENLIPLMHTLDLLGRGIGGLSAIGLALLMYRVALGAELERAAWRLNGVAWVLPLPSIVLVMVPKQVAWFTIVLVFLVLLFWLTLLARYALALFEMQRSVTWVMRDHARNIGRDERVAERQREMDEQLSQTMRPLPRTPTQEIPFDE